MILRLQLFIILVLALGSWRNSCDKYLTYLPVADTLQAGITAIYDSSGLLEKYHAHVITPVCENDKCYLIELDLYWDQIGRFLRYDTITGKGLTRLDHIPFTEEDYERLHSILRNSQSILFSYSKDELVKNSRPSRIDGFTGATIEEIKASVIGGAVYSCYTLWHLANGPVADSIQKVTAQALNRKLVQLLVNQQDQETNYFLVNKFSEEEFGIYLPELLQTFQGAEGYYLKNAIELMPRGVIEDSRSQEFFSVNFDELDYFTQVALLEKLSTDSLSDGLKETLKKNISERGSYLNDLIRELISH